MRVSFLLFHFYYSLTNPCVGFDQVLHRDLGDSKYRLGPKPMQVHLPWNDTFLIKQCWYLQKDRIVPRSSSTLGELCCTKS